MPIYEYECGACSHTFDTLQKFSDAALTRCPKCNEESLRKLISAAAFRLKGEGWYETDFKSGNKKNIAGSESAEKSTSESGDAAKNAKKPEQSGSESKGGSDSKKTGEKSATTSKNNSTESTASKG